MTHEITNLRTSADSRFAQLRSQVLREERLEEEIAKYPRSLKAAEYEVDRLQANRIATRLPDEMWFATLTFPSTFGRPEDVESTRELAEGVLRRHLHRMNKWLFGRAYSKHRTQRLAVFSCFELTPINRSPHFHLLVANPRNSLRAPKFREAFLGSWCRATGGRETAQRMDLESQGKQRAMAYVAKNTVLASGTLASGLLRGEFDAINSCY